jgi:glycosyltransferase involved in cell wall biosynthesis
MPKVTVLCPCRNEEANLAACLDSVAWADEILVVDSGSTDGTLAIARRYTDRVLEHEYVNSATQKNWAIPQAAHGWVMVIDADERVTPELQAEIRALLAEEPPLDGYRIPRRNFFFGTRIHHCGWDADAPLRLFRRDLSRYEEKHVHADVVVESGRVGRLAGELEHHTYRSFDQYLEKFGRYTTWSALDLKARGRRATAWSLTVRPVFRFFRQYVLRQGFRDGKAGFVLCVLAAFSVFMKYAKLWIMERVERGEEGIEVGRTEW